MRAEALAYLRVCAAGAPAATIWLVVNGIFRGLGDTATPLLWALVFALVAHPLMLISSSEPVSPLLRRRHGSGHAVLNPRQLIRGHSGSLRNVGQPQGDAGPPHDSCSSALGLQHQLYLLH